MIKDNMCQSNNNAYDETIDLAPLGMLLTAIGAAFKEIESRVEPTNRVLIPKEIVRIDGAVWLEEKSGKLTSPPIPMLVYGEDDCDNNISCIVFVNVNADKINYLVSDYNHNWRCWLRKPTEAERQGTPWAGDSHE